MAKKHSGRVECLKCLAKTLVYKFPEPMVCPKCGARGVQYNHFATTRAFNALLFGRR
jgi:hypothetical protein